MKRIILIIIVSSISNIIYSGLPFIEYMNERNITRTTDQPYSSNENQNDQVCLSNIAYCPDRMSFIGSVPVEFNGRTYVGCQCTS